MFTKLKTKLHRYYTPEQITIFNMFWIFLSLTIICCLFRLVGLNFLAADLSGIYVPPRWVQDIVNYLLAVYEAVIFSKIVSRLSWKICIPYASICVLLIQFIPNDLIHNILYIVMYFAIAIIGNKNKLCLLETALAYIVFTLYGLLFLVGRIGFTGVIHDSYLYGIISILDYKLFFITAYLYLLNFGGIKLWKKTFLVQKKQLAEQERKNQKV